MIQVCGWEVEISNHPHIRLMIYALRAGLYESVTCKYVLIVLAVRTSRRASTTGKYKRIKSRADDSYELSIKCSIRRAEPSQGSARFGQSTIIDTVPPAGKIPDA